MTNDPTRWKKIREVFDAVNELPPGERASYLADLRISDRTVFQEITELLDADERAEGFLSEPLMLNSNESLEGQSIGHYRIVREIGRGGMGAVFEALREDGEFEHKAAVKLTNHNLFSTELVRRFSTEKQVLARLEHPNIVRLLDGGITANHVPFFVMEYVEGVPLTEFCLSRGLSIRERLGIFLQVCDAVSYAHRQLIVHRDLKPTNILVTDDGQAKLLDFGIAKILDTNAETVTVNAPLTPEYASPEQIRGDLISTATDVYSLGVILYEILTGVPPAKIYGVEPLDLRRGVCENEPARPSSAFRTSSKSGNGRSTHDQEREVRTLRGDLDNIVLKSMQKEPEQRYASVEQFADDIRAYLDGLAVKAHPQSSLYRANKFVRRNRVPVVVAAAAVILVLAAASIAVWQAFAARKQRLAAEENFAHVRTLANSLILDYHDEIAKLEGSTLLREKLVNDALNYLDAISQNANDDAGLLKELAVAYRKVGDVQGLPYSPNLGRTDDAAHNYNRSVQLLERAAMLAPEDVAIKDEMVRSYNALAMIGSRIAVNETATMEKALAVSEELTRLEPENNERKAAWMRIKMMLIGGLDDAHAVRIEEYKKLIDYAMPLLGADPNRVSLVAFMASITERTGTQYRWWGNTLETAGDAEGARNVYVEGLKYTTMSLEYMTRRRDLEPTDIRNRRRMFVANANLSIILITLERPADAEKYLKEAEILVGELRREDPNNKETILDEITIYRDKYMIFSQQNKPELAVETGRKGLEMAREYYKANQTNGEAEAWIGFFSKHLIEDLEKLKRTAELRILRSEYDEFKRAFKARVGTDFIDHGFGL